jgi:putative mRNA 3-end processing factor
LLIAPPAAHRSRGLGRFAKAQTGFVSGWMAVRGARRRRGYGKGFVMSDHADWAGLLRSVRESQAQQVYVTHGQSNVLARYLREVEGISAEPLEGHFEAERFEDDEAAPNQDAPAAEPGR